MNKNFILLLAFFILVPVISIGHYRLMPQELFLYIFIVFHIMKNRFKLFLSVQSRFFLYYFLAFTSMLTFVTILSFTPYTKYDIYMSRQILQFFIASILFSKIFGTLRYHDIYDIEKYVYISLYILSIPSVIAIIQIYNIFDLQDVITNFYQPVFGFTPWEELKSFRTPSVFKDFFTFAVYMVILNTTIYYWYIISKLSLFRRNGLLLLFIFNFMTQLYVARTSLLFIPAAVVMVFPLIMRHRLFLKRYIKAALLFMISIILLLLVVNPEKFSWALEILNVFSVSFESFSSVADMSRMNNLFLQYLQQHFFMVIIPCHEYNVLYTDQSFYTDNFYLQEIVRYGLYGALTYLLFHLAALWSLYKRKSILFVFTVILMVLNYKGGNTLFMTKNIYMYAFIITLLLKIEPFMFYESAKLPGPEGWEP